MAWATITTSSILTVISQAELNKYTTTSTGSMYNSSSLLQEIINDSIAEVRGYVSGQFRNSLDTNTSLIPSVTVNNCKHMIVYRLMERCAGKIADINESRLNCYEKAIQYMIDISNGKIGIDPTDNPIIPSQQGYPFLGDSSTVVDI